MLKRLHIVLVLILTQISWAQDIHFSQTERSYLNLNPAFCGFENAVNVSMNYKTQWNPTLSPFNTYLISGDMCLSRNDRSKFDMSLGGMISRDQAGDPQLNTTMVNLYLSSKIRLTKNQSFGAGLFVGYRQVATGEADGQWASQFDGSQYDSDIDSGESFAQLKYGGINSGVGVVYHLGASKRSVQDGSAKTLTAGAAIYNLNRPREGFFINSTERLRQRMSFFVKSSLGFRGSILSVEPSTFYHRQGPFQELQFGTYLAVDLLNSGQYIGKMSELKVGVGLFHRIRDALIFKAYGTVDDFSVGMSYDFNISPLMLSSNVRGGIEFYLGYQLKSFKK